MAAMDYTIEDNGKERVVDDTHVVNELKRMGHDVMGVTADGQMLQINAPDAKGKMESLEIPVEHALNTLGYKVTKAVPSDPDKSGMHPAWGAELQSLPEVPEARKAFLEAKLRHAGIDNPQVIGHGDDYHVFDPSTSKWHQVTESPGANMTGLLSAGLALPHLIGMGVGGTLGAAAGGALGGASGGGAASAATAGAGAVPGAVAGGATGAFLGGTAGAAAGSALGETGRQALLSALDSDYADQAGSHLAEEGWNAAKVAGMDALGHGAAGVVGKYVPKGLVSSAVKTGGRALESLGTGTRKLAGWVASSPVATDLATDLIPYAGPVNALADIGQLPHAAVSSAAKALANLSEESYLPDLIGNDTFLGSMLGNNADRRLASGVKSIVGPERVSRLSNLGSDLLKQRGPSNLRDSMRQGAEKLAERMGSPPAQQAPGGVKAADVLENAAARVKGAMQYAAEPEWASEEAAMRSSGDHAGADLFRDESQRWLASGHASPEARTAGKIIDASANVGRGIAGVIQGATKTGLRATQALGALGEGAGGLIANGATIAQPLELPASLRYGVPRVMNWWEDQRRR